MQHGNGQEESTSCPLDSHVLCVVLRCAATASKQHFCNDIKQCVCCVSTLLSCNCIGKIFVMFPVHQKRANILLKISCAGCFSDSDIYIYDAAVYLSTGPAQTESRTCVPQVAVCPASCTCNNNIVDCRRKGLTEIPANLPEGIVEM